MCMYLPLRDTAESLLNVNIFSSLLQDISSKIIKVLLPSEINHQLYAAPFSKHIHVNMIHPLHNFILRHSQPKKLSYMLHYFFWALVGHAQLNVLRILSSVGDRGLP